MSSAAPHPLFSIPELLLLILQRVEDPRTLAISAQVSRSWCSHAIRILWHGGRFNYTNVEYARWVTPSLEVLFKLAAESPQRLSYHLRLARRISLRADGFSAFAKEELFNAPGQEGDMYTRWMSVQRPRLETLLESRVFQDCSRAKDIMIDFSTGAFKNEHMGDLGERMALQLLTPQIANIILKGVPIGDVFLDQVSRRCPQLKYFAVHDYAAKSTCSEAAAQRFLERLPRLRGVLLPEVCFFHDDSPEQSSNPLTTFMLRMQHLESFSDYCYARNADRAIRACHIQEASDGGKHELLPSMTSLTLTRTEANLLSRLLTNTQTLQKLVLTFQTDQHNVDTLILAPISRRRTITEVNLIFSQDADYTSHGLTTLARGCPSLKKLMIHSTSRRQELVFTESNILHLATSMLGIEDFTLCSGLRVIEGPILQSIRAEFAASSEPRAVDEQEDVAMSAPTSVHGLLQQALRTLPALHAFTTIYSRRLDLRGHVIVDRSLISCLCLGIAEICKERKKLRSC